MITKESKSLLAIWISSEELYLAFQDIKTNEISYDNRLKITDFGNYSLKREKRGKARLVVINEKGEIQMFWDDYSIEQGEEYTLTIRKREGG